MAKAPVFLTISQTAEILGVSRRVVRRLIDVGILPAFRPGPHSIRIPAEAVQAHLEASRFPVAGTP